MQKIRQQPKRFQSTPPREGGDDDRMVEIDKSIDISIHAPREGGDGICVLLCTECFISIHAPREGGDSPAMAITDAMEQAFQSTPPARGATHCFQL